MSWIYHFLKHLIFVVVLNPEYFHRLIDWKDALFTTLYFGFFIYLVYLYQLYFWKHDSRLQRIPAITSVLDDKAELVKYNLTTNKAESFANIPMHFEGEKIVDRSQARSFTSPAHGTEAIIFQFCCLSFFRLKSSAWLVDVYILGQRMVLETWWD